MAIEDELIAIRLELKGQRETVAGLKEVDRAQEGVGTTTTRAGTAATKAEKSTSHLGRAYSKLGQAARYGLGFLGVGGIFALKSAVDHTEELSKTTSGLSRNFGLQTNVASRWAAVAQSRGIDGKALSTTFSVLSSKMVDAARKGGTALTPFHQLGISQEELVKHSNDAGWGIMRVTQALGEEAGGAKRSAAAKGVLGKGFQTLVPLMSEGTKGLKEQLHWADKYGDVLTNKTNDAVMESVMAQRESKVAIGGLQTQMTMALLPAIDASNRQLQEFTQTLNDPKLTDDQKLHRIEQQFLGIEDTLIQVISDALPKVAEHGGELGIKLAGAVWSGFKNSGPLGKLFIGLWLFNAIGGMNAIGRLGGKVGGKLATSLGRKFLETVAPYFAAEAGVEGLGSALGSQMGGLRTLFAGKGKLLGTVMGLAAAGALIAEIIFAVENSEDIAGLSLFDTPNTGVTSIEEEAQYLKGLGYTEIGFNSGRELEATDPKGHHVTEIRKGKQWIEKPGGDRQKPGAGRRRHAAMRLDTPPLPQLTNTAGWRLGGGGGRPNGPSHIHIHIDGREVSEVVAHHVADAEALA